MGLIVVCARSMGLTIHSGPHLFYPYVAVMKRSLPPSPAADEPDEPPPREAVVSEDTKTYDRGRRRGDTHTHTH